MVNGQRRGGAESENFVMDEGQSSESVTYICNSAGPPQDYESSDTSLKLGSVFINTLTQTFRTQLTFPYFDKS